MEWACTTSARNREPSELSQAQGLQVIELTAGQLNRSRTRNLRSPLEEPSLNQGHDQIDEEDKDGENHEPGKDARGVKDAFGLGNEVTQPLCRAQVFAHHRADQRHPHARVEAGQNPAHGRRQKDVAEEVPFIGSQHPRVVEDVRVNLPDPPVGVEKDDEKDEGHSEGHFGQDPESKPEGEDRRQRNPGQGIGNLDVRVEKAGQRRDARKEQAQDHAEE
jgi:hypothetical protein